MVKFHHSLIFLLPDSRSVPHYKVYQSTPILPLNDASYTFTLLEAYLRRTTLLCKILVFVRYHC